MILASRTPVEGVPQVRIADATFRYPYGILARLDFAFRVSKRAFVDRAIESWHDVDLVHAHGDLVDAFLAHHVARATSAKSVLTIHGGLGARYVPLRRVAFSKMDAIVAVSQSIQLELVGSFGYPHESVHVVSSGLDVTALAAPAVHASSGRLEVISVGALDRVKGHDLAIDAVLAASPSDIRLTIVGAGPEEASLRRKARGTNSVRFVGHVPQDRVYSLLSDSDIFLMMSRDTGGKHEGRPTSLMEAMAHGLPVVAAASGGIPELVTHGVDGFLVAKEDVAGAAAAIQRLTDAELRSTMGTRARQRVSGLSWTKICAEIDKVYQSIVNGY